MIVPEVTTDLVGMGLVVGVIAIQIRHPSTWRLSRNPGGKA